MTIVIMGWSSFVLGMMTEEAGNWTLMKNNVHSVWIFKAKDKPGFGPKPGPAWTFITDII